MGSFAKFLQIIAIFSILILVALPVYGVACPVCFGAPPDSSLTKSMNMAIFTMLGITGTLMGLFGTFFIYLRKKAKQL